ncbi:hypothetical protein L7F22_045325 [Adiantum nelumboides]|nr:hypothetical protein [Adiantum nelumboides]
MSEEIDHSRWRMDTGRTSRRKEKPVRHRSGTLDGHYKRDKAQCQEPDKPVVTEVKQPKHVLVRAITRSSGVLIEELPVEELASSKLNPEAKEWEHHRSTWKEKGKAKEFDEWKEQREVTAKITENLSKRNPEIVECSEAKTVQGTLVPVAEALLLETQTVGTYSIPVDYSDDNSDSKKEKSLPAVAKFIKQKKQQAKAMKVEVPKIKIDEVPVIQVDYKNKKQWKPLSGVILDGGAGVNIIGEHMKEKMEDRISLSSSATGQREYNKQKSSTNTANNEEVESSLEQIYEYCSDDEVDSNPTVEVKIDKEAKAMAKRKSGMPNWLLPDDQEVEEWNLGSEDDPKMIKINKHLKKELKDKSWNLFLRFRDVFAWERVDPEVCQHRIPLKPDAKPIRLQRYRMNPNYAKKIEEKIDNLLKAGFITEVESSDWLFPIVVVLKKNGKLRVCVDDRKLTFAHTIKDPCPIPFTDMMSDEIVGHEMYSFMDGYIVYNQLKIAPEDREKTTFITEWGAFMYLVMPFGLCNAPATFQCCMLEIFSKFLHRFLAIFVDDFTIYSTQNCIYTVSRNGVLAMHRKEDVHESI